jgi:hypothetical protein
MFNNQVIRLFSTIHTTAIDIDRTGNYVPVCYSTGDGSRTTPFEARLDDHWAAVVFQETLLTSSLAASGATAATATTTLVYPSSELAQTLHHAVQAVLRRFDQLENTFFGHLAGLAAAAKQHFEHLQQSTGLLVTLRDRRDVKPPFWQRCDTEHLAEVLARVFTASSSTSTSPSSSAALSA